MITENDFVLSDAAKTNGKCLHAIGETQYPEYPEKYPECLKKLLIASGFTTIASLRLINEQNLSTIEKFMQSNKHLVAAFDRCNKEQYQPQNEFRFLPGHKCIIASIPMQIDEMTQKQIAVKSQKSLILSNDDLTNKLVSNLNQYFGRNYKYDSTEEKFTNGDDVVSQRNIINFERKADTARCNFSGPFCSKIFPVKERMTILPLIVP